MPITQTQEEIRSLNERFLDMLESPHGTKAAADAVTDYTRLKLREEGFYRKLMPTVPISNDELDRQVDTDKPVKVVDKEVDNPAALSIPFGTLPKGTYIRGDRYPVAFARIVSRKFMKEVEELRTYDMDIRQVVSDNATKDIMTEEDSKFIGAVNNALIGPDTPVIWSGIAQWVTLFGGISRDTFAESLKVMPKTDARLAVARILVNSVTIYEFLKWGRDEIGGDFAEDLLKQGWSERSLMGCELLITIKRGLVPDDSIYGFADPKFIGKSFELQPPTMYVKREAYLMEFFLWETLGGGIGHTPGLMRVDFA